MCLFIKLRFCTIFYSRSCQYSYLQISNNWEYFYLPTPWKQHQNVPAIKVCLWLWLWADYENCQPSNLSSPVDDAKYLFFFMLQFLITVCLSWQWRKVAVVMKALEGFYQVLGIPSQSSIEDVKEAFLKKSYSSLPERFPLIFYKLSSIKNFEDFGYIPTMRSQPSQFGIFFCLFILFAYGRVLGEP